MSEADHRTLSEADADPDPIRQFATWFEEAAGAGLYQPEAMTLATVGPDGRPSARMVLLRGFDGRGFSFFTNYDSRKARDLAARPWAALVLFWAELHRQVRIEGRVEPVSAEESNAYFAGRARGSQLSAWASPQSEVLEGRGVLERRVEELARQYEGRPVPRPPRWGGYRVVPDSVEFWQGRENRLHDRLCYRRRADGGWAVVRLAP
jgi:pyridoxamine 5'-phosphate oxidase